MTESVRRDSCQPKGIEGFGMAETYVAPGGRRGRKAPPKVAARTGAPARRSPTPLRIREPNWLGRGGAPFGLRVDLSSLTG